MSPEKLDVVLQQIDLIRDKLGIPIDKNIKKLVTILCSFNFTTSGSCEGHADYGLSYPWIDIDNELWSEDGKNNNYLQLKRFECLTGDFKDFEIEYFGIFNAFRIKFPSLKEVNQLESYLLRKYED